MTIAELRETCKRVAGASRDAVMLAITILASALSFGFGYLAGLDAADKGIEITTSPLVATSSDERVIGSKSGMKYFLPWCAGAARISVANAVWFASVEAAQAAGYAPAGNCAGL